MPDGQLGIHTMPKSNSANPKPVVKPTAAILLGVSLALLAAGLALLFLGETEQHTVAAFFFLALLGATVTFGLLGATGMVKTKKWQLGGSAGIFAAILSLLLPFAGGAVREIKGTVYLDDAVVREATVVLLESDRAGNEQKIEARDSGQFRFTVGEKKKSYKFRVVLPQLGETNLSLPATGGWLTLRVISKQFARVEEKPREPMGELCKVESGSCTLFLFDYLHDQISGDELQAFHNFQTDRLDKGIRNYLSSRNLLEGLSFRVKRCSATAVNDSSRAAEAAGLLKVPAVLWGFIKRADNKLISATTITMVEGQPMNLGTREVLGNDVTELIGLDRPVLGTPLAMASFVVGDIHLRQGRADLARRAFLDALELAGGLDPRDKVEFMQAVNSRLQKLERSNPAAGLTPIGDPNG